MDARNKIPRERIPIRGMRNAGDGRVEMTWPATFTAGETARVAMDLQ